MMRVLIDTNIYSLAMRGNKTVIEYLQRIDQIGFSSISIGELWSGFKGGNNLNKKSHRATSVFRFTPFKNIYGRC